MSLLVSLLGFLFLSLLEPLLVLLLVLLLGFLFLSLLEPL